MTVAVAVELAENGDPKDPKKDIDESEDEVDGVDEKDTAGRKSESVASKPPYQPCRSKPLTLV